MLLALLLCFIKLSENLPKKWNESSVAEKVKSGDSCDCVNLVCNAGNHLLERGGDTCTEMSSFMVNQVKGGRKLKKVHSLRQEEPLDLAERNSVQALEL